MRGVTNNAYQERANAGIKSTVLRSTGFDPPDQLPARAGGDRPGKCQPGLSPGKGSSGENSNGRAEGGAGGGTVVAQGTPEEVAKVGESFTGQYLAEVLAKEAARDAAAQ